MLKEGKKVGDDCNHGSGLVDGGIEWTFKHIIVEDENGKDSPNNRVISGLTDFVKNVDEKY